MVVFLIYGVINITVTFATGRPVYDPISWDSFTAWMLGLAMIPLALGFYVLLYACTKGKFRCLGMQQSKLISAQDDEQQGTWLLNNNR